MPSLHDSRVTLDPSRYREVQQPADAALAAPMQHAPVLPSHLVKSSIFISSLPSIATDVDGITRQFYGSGKFPTRRLILPS